TQDQARAAGRGRQGPADRRRGADRRPHRTHRRRQDLRLPDRRGAAYPDRRARRRRRVVDTGGPSSARALRALRPIERAAPPHAPGPRRPSMAPLGAGLPQPTILLSGYSMIPTAPAWSSFGMRSRTVASAITLSTANQSVP